MKISLIGGSGFIGSRLADLLIPEHDVQILDKAMSKKYPQHTSIVDVLDPKRLTDQLEGWDVVVLLAAEHDDDVSPRSRYYDVNVEGTRNVLAAMRQNAIQKIVFTSSVAVYGMGGAEVSEQDEIRPINDYGRSKWLAEEELRAWQRGDPARELVIVRPTAVIGEGSRGNFDRLIKQMASRRFVMVGRGENQKSLCYVENVAAFIEYCVLAGQLKHDVFNYADKPDLSMNELVRVVRHELGIRGAPLRVPRSLGLLGGLGFALWSRLTRRPSSISRERVARFCATTSCSMTRVEETSFQAPQPLEKAIRRVARAFSINSM